MDITQQRQRTAAQLLALARKASRADLPTYNVLLDKAASVIELHVEPEYRNDALDYWADTVQQYKAIDATLN